MSITPKERKLLIAELPGVTKIDTDVVRYRCSSFLKSRKQCSKTAAWEFRSISYPVIDHVCYQHLETVMQDSREDYDRLNTWYKKKQDRVLVKLFGRARVEELKNEHLQSVSVSD